MRQGAKLACKRMLGTSAIFLVLVTSACGPVTKSSLVGKYRFVGAPQQASLDMRKDGTYQLCTPEKGCATGTYLASDAYEKNDRVEFAGRAFGAFVFGDPPRNAEGQALPPAKGAAAWIEFDLMGYPHIGFDDPDTGDFFEKI